MRVTTNAFNNGFLNSYNSLLADYLKSQKKVLTQRRYTRASEDSSSAAKAVHVRKSLENLATYDENLKTAKDFYYAAEDALYDIANKTYLDVEQKVISVQDTMNQTQLDILAVEIEQFADHMIQDMNSDFASRQMFGGSSNDKTPFTVYERVEIEYDAPEIDPATGNPTGNLIRKTLVVGDAPDEGINKTTGEAVNHFTACEDFFYDKNGNEICPVDDLKGVSDGTELYSKAGTQYPVVVSTREDGTRCLVTNAREYDDDQTNHDKSAIDKVYPQEKNIYTVYKPDDKFYTDDTLTTEVKFEDYKTGDKYYDKYGNEFTVNGRIDSADSYYNKNNQFKHDKIVCYNGIPVVLNDENINKFISGKNAAVKYYTNASDLPDKPADEKDIDCPNQAGKSGASLYPGSNPVFVDIGLGIKYYSDGTVNPSTALDMGLNGAELTGCGLDKENDAMNLMQLVYDTAAALRNGDVSSVNKYIDKLEEAKTTVLKGITTLGVKQTTMQMYIDRNEVYRLSLSEKQNTLERTDIEREITNLKTVEAAYNAALAMGGSILPKSIFDFV